MFLLPLPEQHMHTQVIDIPYLSPTYTIQGSIPGKLSRMFMINFDGFSHGDGYSVFSVGVI